MSEPTRSRGSSGRTRDLTPPPAPEPLPLPVADAHCHLDIVDGTEWVPTADALAKSAAVGVPRIVQVGCDRPGVEWAVRAAEEHEAIVAAVAMHPNEAPLLAERGELADALEQVRAAAARPRVRAVGETGLDFFRTPPEGRGVQEESFREHIAIADAVGKPVMIHDRDSHADVLRVLADKAPERVIFHCYSGDAAMAEECARHGWFLSFAGTVTFKNAAGLRDALAVTPIDNVLVETDAPFLAPTPYRGRPNASYLIPLTVRVMAEVKGVSVERMCEAVAANTERAFGAW
ncbi:TatD DNase family protein [Motilibacter rhizosphaerae]|uniref:TatD DNase family protein n=1 Tax=Motilibacter rhizosphaerae TaxID=598652 RepID=A0A4Q7NQ32_9ACTN|nr:TatD family hydrolase [Motilibacter rhizosphaerae]RZS87435.1 TatD DNase family protein [Motilibacter rhizosphaerae]